MKNFEEKKLGMGLSIYKGVEGYYLFNTNFSMDSKFFNVGFFKCIDAAMVKAAQWKQETIEICNR